MKITDSLEWIQSWFLKQCDGSYEHELGISITTLDNPGWKVAIALNGTDYYNLVMQPLKLERTENDWLHCKIENNVFFAFCGPQNLEEAIASFRLLVEDPLQ